MRAVSSSPPIIPQVRAERMREMETLRILQEHDQRMAHEAGIRAQRQALEQEQLRKQREAEQQELQLLQLNVELQQLEQQTRTQVLMRGGGGGRRGSRTEEEWEGARD